MSSSSPPCNGVRRVLLIFAMEEAVYLWDRGQTVWRVLYHKIEDKEWATPPLPLSHKYDTSSITRMMSTLHTPSWGGDTEYTPYSSSLQWSTQPTPHPPVHDEIHGIGTPLLPPHNWVCGLLLLFHLSHIKLVSMTSIRVPAIIVYCSHQYVVRYVFSLCAIRFARSKL